MAARAKTTKSGSTATERGPRGRWKPGVSANPSGRPKTPESVVEAARAFSEEAIATLGELMRTGQPRIRLLAANSLLDRAHGKAIQPHEIKPERLADDDLKVRAWKIMEKQRAEVEELVKLQ